MSYSNNVSFQFPKFFVFQPFYDDFINSIEINIKDQVKREYLKELFEDQEKFEWWYDIVISRAFSINIKEYSKMTNDTDSDNMKLNKRIFKDKASVLIPGVEIANHKFRSINDLNDFNGFNFYVEPGKLNFVSKRNLIIGEEYTHSYSSDLTNQYLLQSYGIASRYNAQDKLTLFSSQPSSKDVLDPSKIQLCAQLNWGDNTKSSELELEQYRVIDSFNVTEKEVQMKVTFRTYSEQFLMYLRVLRLPENLVDDLRVLENVRAYGFIYFKNEIGSIQDYVQMLANTVMSKPLKHADLNLLEKLEKQLETINLKEQPEKAQTLMNKISALEASISEK